MIAGRFLAFPIACLTCYANFSLSSIVTPITYRYLADFFQFIAAFSTYSLLENLDDLFENETAVVFDVCFPFSTPRFREVIYFLLDVIDGEIVVAAIDA